MSRGQFSAEILIIISFLFILLLASVYYKIYIDYSNKILEQKYKEVKNCSELSELISRVYISGKGTYAEYILDYPALIKKEDEVCVENLCCYFTGEISSDIALSAGIVKIGFWDSLVIENES